jgi:hypothetical protein
MLSWKNRQQASGRERSTDRSNADYLMLSDLIGRTDVLEPACGRCERRGRLSGSRLAARLRIGSAAAGEQERDGVTPTARAFAAVRRALIARGCSTELAANPAKGGRSSVSSTECRAQ